MTSNRQQSKLVLGGCVSAIGHITPMVRRELMDMSHAIAIEGQRLIRSVTEMPAGSERRRAK